MSERTAHGAMTLPGKYYTAEAIFRAETGLIFSKRWLYIGRISQLTKAGRYFLHNLDNESLIVLRDGQGKIRAFYNVCRHRGTRLCTEAEGSFRNPFNALITLGHMRWTAV